MKLRVTENNQFLRLYEATEEELEQVKFSLKKRIRGHFYNPLVKKNFGMATSLSIRTVTSLSVSGTKSIN
jgi:hypothetical protein